MLTFSAQKIVKLANILGESPVWCHERECIFWLDILSQALYQFTPSSNKVQCWSLPFIASAVLLSENPDILVLVTDRGVVSFNLTCKHFTLLVKYPENKSMTRPNEAQVDPFGNILFGTMSYDSQLIGNLYQFNEKGLVKLYTSIGIPNTFIWIKKVTDYQLYFFDSQQKILFSSPYNRDTLMLNPKPIFHIEQGSPDGSALDEKNTLWNARWGIGQVINTTVQGKKLGCIQLPAIQPTSCVFGGKALSTLFITTATYGLQKKSPADGALYAANLKVKGKAGFRVKRQVYRKKVNYHAQRCSI